MGLSGPMCVSMGDPQTWHPAGVSTGMSSRGRGHGWDWAVVDMYHNVRENDPSESYTKSIGEVWTVSMQRRVLVHSLS